ncbi:MAG: hypothetical protein JW891_13210 [Candidatus Lokiarchaeota archaeon]|nr:hypothetical protein [Candidatus Lokiarchaeota archaeon]
MLVFQIVDEGYEKIETDEMVTLYKLLDTEKVLFIVDDEKSKVWTWVGKTTTTKMKFISARLALEIRNKYGVTYDIITVDEDNEPDDFMDLLMLEDLIT